MGGTAAAGAGRSRAAWWGGVAGGRPPPRSCRRGFPVPPSCPREALLAQAVAVHLDDHVTPGLTDFAPYFGRFCAFSASLLVANALFGHHPAPVQPRMGQDALVGFPRAMRELGYIRFSGGRLPARLGAPLGVAPGRSIWATEDSWCVKPEPPRPGNEPEVPFPCGPGGLLAFPPRPPRPPPEDRPSGLIPSHPASRRRTEATALRRRDPPGTLGDAEWPSGMLRLEATEGEGCASRACTT